MTGHVASPPRAGRRLLRPLLAAVLAAETAAMLLILSAHSASETDTPVYHRYAEAVMRGEIPYRDFSLEYPPGALLPFLLPDLFGRGRREYDIAFAILMVLALTALAVLLVLTLDALGVEGGQLVVAPGTLAVGVVLLGPFVLTRFDLYAAALTAAAVCALVRGRPMLGSALLGVAVATKIYPAVLVPLVVARAWRQGGRGAALRSAGTTVAAVAAVYLPFVLGSPVGVAQSAWRQLGRPLQIESLPAGFLLVAHNLADVTVGWSAGHGSQNLTGTAATLGASLSTLLGAAALMVVWVRFARGDASDDERFIRYAAAATVAFVAFGKVLSPQFLVWLLVSVPLVAGRRGRIASILLLVACGLTRVWYPRAYEALVLRFDATMSSLVLVRDVVLVVILVVLLARVDGRAPRLLQRSGASAWTR